MNSSYTPFRVSWKYQGIRSSTTFGDEAAARAFAAVMRKRGVRCVTVSKV